MLAHCGSLYLDPAVLSEVYHELCLLETLLRKPHRWARSMAVAVSCLIFKYSLP